MRFDLQSFVTESNRIEGIHRAPYRFEIDAHKRLLKCKYPTVDDVACFVTEVAPHAKLRSEKGMDVRVGDHFPIGGGKQVVDTFIDLMNKALDLTPHELHCRYEVLHPFMDGNGRSGRALWLWRMGGIEKAPLGFLHHFYYQTLSGFRG